MKTGRFLSTVLCLAVLFTCRAANAYSIFVMSPLGFENSLAEASNSRGHTTGWLYNSNAPYGEPHAFFYGGGITLDIGAAFPGLSEGMAINDREQVAGRYYDGLGIQHGFIWDRATGPRDLGDLGGNDTVAYAINALGDVTGSSELPNGDTHAFLWHKGVMIDLGAFGEPGAITVGLKINRVRQIAGLLYSSAGISTFIWDAAGGMRTIPDLGGGMTFPHKLNDSGWIVGESATEVGEVHAFVYRGGTTLDLTPDSPFARASDINEHGIAVGTDYGLDGQRAFQWDPISGFQDIHPAGALSSTADAINDRGMVAGTLLWSDVRIYPFVIISGRTQIIGMGMPDRMFVETVGIDSRGDIVGNLWSVSGNGYRGYFAVR
jgi:probable HAF family extracellular repeat protein